MTDASSEGESEENLSPIRRVHKLIHSSEKPKPRRKKKMPPELKIIPAPVNIDNINFASIFNENNDEYSSFLHIDVFFRRATRRIIPTVKRKSLKVQDLEVYRCLMKQ